MKDHCMYVDNKQNVAGTTWCWFGRQIWNCARSQWMSHDRKIREEDDFIHGNGDGETEIDSGDI